MHNRTIGYATETPIKTCNMSLALEPNEAMSAKQEYEYIIEAPPRQCNAILTTHLSVTDFSPIMNSEAPIASLTAP